MNSEHEIFKKSALFRGLSFFHAAYNSETEGGTGEERGGGVARYILVYNR